MATTSREEVDVKKHLLDPQTSDAAFVVPARRRAASSYACAPRAAWKALGSAVTGTTSFAGATSPSTEAHLSHLGSNGRMAITNGAHRRPPETPT